MESFQQKAQKMCKNKLALLCLFVFITFVLSTIIYYSKIFDKNPDKNPENNPNKNETNTEIAIRCVIPGMALALLVVLVLFFADFPKKEPLVSFGFYD